MTIIAFIIGVVCMGLAACSTETETPQTREDNSGTTDAPRDTATSNTGTDGGSNTDPGTSDSQTDFGDSDTASDGPMIGTEGTPWIYDIDQPTRLRITNRCQYPIWIQFGDGDGRRNVLERLNPGINNRKFQPDDRWDYVIPDEGDVDAIIDLGIALEGTRFWVKRGCDDKGDNCVVGQSRTNSDGSCPPGGCQPPIESKMEATWAAMSSSTVTWYNASHVDGYTEPYVIIPKGEEAKAASDCIPINASMLDAAADCPVHENLTDPRFTDLDLRFAPAGETLGCYSPCKKLTFDEHLDEWTDPLALRMCCPTNLSGTPWPGLTSEECNDRDHEYSIWKTRYLSHLKVAAPTVYTFAYDDAESLFTCPGETRFELIFCPTPSRAQPRKLLDFYEKYNRPLPDSFEGLTFF